MRKTRIAVVLQAIALSVALPAWAAGTGDASKSPIDPSPTQAQRMQSPRDAVPDPSMRLPSQPEALPSQKALPSRHALPSDSDDASSERSSPGSDLTGSDTQSPGNAQDRTRVNPSKHPPTSVMDSATPSQNDGTAGATGKRTEKHPPTSVMDRAMPEQQSPDAANGQKSRPGTSSSSPQ